MNTFNLKNILSAQRQDFVKKYVEAMGYTHQKNRQPLHWWDYEKLKGSPDETWNNWSMENPSLQNMLSELGYDREKRISQIAKDYGVPSTTAAKMLKSFIGYHPSYGGYLCQVGPYQSEGYIPGPSHIISAAIDKFHYYTWRKARYTAEDMADLLSKNISSYQKDYKVQFTPDDFAMKVSPPEPFDPARMVSKKDPTKKGRQPRRKVLTYVDSLDPTNPATQQYFHTQPMIMEGTTIELNTRGYAKLLQQLMGPWYQKVITEVAASENKNPQEVAKDVNLHRELLEKVYEQTYAKWKMAAESGDPSAIGMPTPPVFQDKSLKTTAGQRYYSTTPKNEGMENQLKLRLEVLQILEEGIFETSEIAERLNSAPKRQKLIKNKMTKGESPIIFTENDVERIIASINKMKEEGKDTTQIATETGGNISKMTEGRGYDDLKTALDMASLYFSGSDLAVDPQSGAKLGEANMVFSPQGDFENFTSQDLMELRQGKAKQEQVAKETATPEQIKEDIGENMPEPEKVPAKTPEVTEEAVAEEKPNVPQQQVDPEFLEDLLGGTLQNLIKVAEDLDKNGKYVEAEEVHKIIRKYAKRIL